MAGNWVNTRCRATGPPVDVPMATSLKALRFGAGDDAVAACVRAGIGAGRTGALLP
ncbi:hypothetical protein D3C71_1672200 [compost metagenome]